MKKFPKIMLITLGFGLATLLTGFLTSRPTTAQHVTPVRVTNTPLPVNGNVTVGNFPATQNVTISGTPNVNVTNTPLPVTGTVSLSGNTAATPLLVRNVDDPARQP